MEMRIQTASTNYKPTKTTIPWAYCHAAQQKFSTVLEECTVPIFRVKE
jgi:hypothetical protein